MKNAPEVQETNKPKVQDYPARRTLSGKLVEGASAAHTVFGLAVLRGMQGRMLYAGIPSARRKGRKKANKAQRQARKKAYR